MDHENIVVGSGPAGVSCAMALLAQGQRVTMVDAGLELETANATKLVTLRETKPDQWSGEPSEWLRSGMQAAIEGIPLKLSYGSDFPYRSLPGAPVVTGDAVNTKFSLSKGGLSNVWGAAVMPYRQNDIAAWPITTSDLAPHYKAVADFMPVAQGTDMLAEEFPVFRETEPLPLSAQGRALQRTLEANAPGLRRKGLTFGRSRLAVNGSGLNAPGGCVRCGLCMYGCPYGLIYSTAETVDRMRADANFRYAPGLVVRRVAEQADGVRLVARGAGESDVEITGRRAFLAAGVLSSTAILLRSLEAFGEPVTLSDSHYFLLPMLRVRSTPEFERGNLHTLAQMFLEIDDPAVSSYTVHLQTYTYNDLFEPPIRQKLGPARHAFPWHAFLSRLYLFQGYLHSAESAQMRATLERTAEGDALRVEPIARAESDQVLAKLLRKIAGMRSEIGMAPLWPLLRRGDPGRGFHTGGSFPMRTQPTGLESDLAGRPAGLRRVHVVDSSVLPSIAATTITYTVMANAHRIGTIVARGEAA